MPPSNEWRAAFHREQQCLRTALGNLVLDIQHVGSTALHSILAKPIIDIGIAVQDFDAAVGCVEPMQGLGYEYRGEAGIARRHYFVKGRPRTHHVHIVEIDSYAWRSLVMFRDYLLEHPDVATQYEDLKQALAAKYATERDAYQTGKKAFVENVIARATRSNA